MHTKVKLPAIKTAIIGYGNSAKNFHLPFVNALNEFEITAISSSQAAAVKQDWPNAKHYLNAEDLLKNSDAQLVIITAPNEVHFSLAKLALENNKHVVLEKPFVTHISDGEILIALAQEKKLVLSVFHNRRWDGDFLTVKKLLAENKLGHIKHYESHFDRFRPVVIKSWREKTNDGGGILFDLGPHLIDQALQLFGMPEAITAQCKIMREDATNIDFFSLTLHYPNMLAVLNASLFSAGPNQRFNVQGQQGNYIKFGLDPQEAKLKAGSPPSVKNFGAESPTHYGMLYSAESAEPVVTEPGCYQHFYLQMADAIDALANIHLIALAMESSQLGKTLKVRI